MAGGAIGALITSKKDPLFMTNGLVAGLVAICSGTDIVSPIAGLIIGLIAGLQVPIVYRFLENRKIDDVCGVVPVHGTAGVVGAILAGIFGMKALGGVGVDPDSVMHIVGNPDIDLLLSQIIGSIFCAFYGIVLGYVVTIAIGFLCNGLRVGREAEIRGLDIVEHNLPAYPEEDTLANRES